MSSILWFRQEDVALGKLFHRVVQETVVAITLNVPEMGSIGTFISLIRNEIRRTVSELKGQFESARNQYLIQ